MKVLLLGGTGAIGKHLAELLVKDDNNEIYISSRSEHQSELNIHYIIGDAHKEDFIREKLGNHFDIIVDFMAYTTEEFRFRVDYMLDKTDQYIYLSSARVYAGSDMLITEQSPRLLDVCDDLEYLKTDEYALAKARQENILYDSKRKNFTIIRPYITYAENRLQLGNLEKEKWLYRGLQGKTVLFCSEISEKYTTLTYGKDVSEGICGIIGNEKCYGEAFHITQSQYMKWKEIWNIYKTIIEEKTQKELKIEFVDLNTYCNIFSNNKYQILYDRMFDRKFDNSKISKYTRKSSFLGIEDGLTNCIADFLNNPVFLYEEYKFDGVIDGYTKDYSRLRKIPGIKNKARYLIGRLGL